MHHVQKVHARQQPDFKRIIDRLYSLDLKMAMLFLSAKKMAFRMKMELTNIVMLFILKSLNCVIAHSSTCGNNVEHRRSYTDNLYPLN